MRFLLFFLFLSAKFAILNINYMNILRTRICVETSQILYSAEQAKVCLCFLIKYVSEWKADMKETGLGAEVPAGKVDKALNVIEGNHYLYDLMGIYIHFSLYKMVLEEDKERLADIVERCIDKKDHCAEELIHIENKEGGFDNYVISMRQCREEDYFYIELFNMTEDKKRTEEMQRQVALARDYLTLNGKILSEYNLSNDSFRLFWLNYEQTVEVSRMSLTEWEEQMLREAYIKKEDENIFMAFCEAMKKVEDIQTYTFTSSIFSNGEHFERCRVKLMQREYDGEQIVLGMWSVINESAEGVYENYVGDANIDSLTRLLNKKAITEYAQRAVEGREKQLAIVVMDIDNFKNVNDTYGHLFGDEVIRAVADVIKKVVGNKGMAGRIGGDEFMFVLEDYENEINLRNFLRSIRVNVAALFQDKLGSERLSCSIGISRSDEDAGEFKDLFKIADRALYIAKQKGKNRYIIYKKELHGPIPIEDNGYDMLDIRQNFYSDKDIRMMNRLLAQVIVQGREELPALLEHAAHTLLVDRITVFWGKSPVKTIAAYKEEHVTDCVPIGILEEEEYLEKFQNNFYVVNSVNRLEYQMPRVYEMFRGTGTFSSMQYLLRNKKGKIKGIILADECKHICSFPLIAERLFENMCEIIQGVLLREEN